MKKQILFTPEEFKKKIYKYIDQSAESLKKKLQQHKKKAMKGYV